MPSDDKVVPLYPGPDGEPMAPADGPRSYAEPDKVLSNAGGQLREVVVMGLTHGGDPYIGSSHSLTRTLAFIELCKQELNDTMRAQLGWLCGPEDDQ